MIRRRARPYSLTPWGATTPPTVRPCDNLVYHTRLRRDIPMDLYREAIQRDMRQYDRLPPKWRRDFQEGRFDK